MGLVERLQVVFDEMKVKGEATVSAGNVEVKLDLNELAHVISAVEAQDKHLETLEKLLFKTFDKYDEEK